MQRAIELAYLAGAEAAPNPMVGAVIVHNDRIIGEGYHRKAGEPHAEVNAVQSVNDLSLLREATLYVTLEPCSHYGKTPPCADLIIRHQFQRVVVGSVDPYAEVAGKGIRKLQDAGINVTIGCLEDQCSELNKRFFGFHLKKRPFVVLKWAQTPQGFIAPSGDSDTREVHWISSPETRSLVHKWRAEEAAILAGWKTILKDNSSLTVRDYDGANPLRVIIDPDLNIPADSVIFHDGVPTLIINKTDAAIKNHIEYIQLPVLNTENILRLLHSRNILSVFVEGGGDTHRQFISSGLWDEARVIIGRNEFKNGIPAPVLSMQPQRSYSFSKDTVLEYKNSATAHKTE